MCDVNDTGRKFSGRVVGPFLCKGMIIWFLYLEGIFPNAKDFSQNILRGTQSISLHSFKILAGTSDLAQLEPTLILYDITVICVIYLRLFVVSDL